MNLQSYSTQIRFRLGTFSMTGAIMTIAYSGTNPNSQLSSYIFAIATYEGGVVLVPGSEEFQCGTIYWADNIFAFQQPSCVLFTCTRPSLCRSLAKDPVSISRTLRGVRVKDKYMYQVRSACVSASGD